MTRKWILCGVCALIGFAGCKSSNQQMSQPAPNANSPTANPTGTANQAMPGQETAEQRQAPEPQPEAPRQVVVPAGTNISVILSTSISAANNQPGDEFEASIASPVSVNGEQVIPKNASASGTVVTAKKQGAIKGEADLSIRLTNIEVRGRDYRVTTNTYGTSAKGKGKRSAEMTGGGAALGALIGGLAGGGRGAAVGAAVGGGGGLAGSAATGGKKLEFPAESRITFRLTEALTIER